MGFISPTGANFGSFVSMEQSIIPQTSSDRRMNLTFALFSMIGTFAMAVGILLAKIPGTFKCSIWF
ncbi:MAG: hypothetical protein QXN83_10500 [Nitrososphaerales archaeon]